MKKSHFYFNQSKKYFIIVVLICNLSLSLGNITAYTQISDNTIILEQYEYHIISVNATKGQALSGDFSATPADLITAPFLVFIIDTMHLIEWENADNLTQAIKRLPADELLYLYDPLIRIDDFPLDGYRTGSFNVKTPHADTWHLVLYAGATVVPLTFSWHLDVFDGYLLDIAFGIIGAVIFVAFVAVFTYKIIKDKKQTYEEEFNQIVQDNNNDDKELNLLERPNEELIEENL